MDGLHYDWDAKTLRESYRVERFQPPEGAKEALRFTDFKAAERFYQAMQAKGRKTSMELAPSPVFPAGHKNEYDIQIGPDIARLATKIALASAYRAGWNIAADQEARNYLLNGVEVQRVMIAGDYDEVFDSWHDPLAHSVCVSGNEEAKTVTALVQFFGHLQLFVFLQREDYTGPNRTSFGTVSLLARKERHELTTYHPLATPNELLNLNEWSTRMVGRLVQQAELAFPGSEVKFGISSVSVGPARS